LACLIVVVITLIVQTYLTACRRKPSYLTKLILAVNNNDDRVSVLLNYLCHPASSYKITIRARPQSMRLIKNIFSYSIVGFGGFSLFNTVLNLPVTVNDKPTVSIWSARRFQRIINTRHVATVEFWDWQNNLIESVVINPELQQLQPLQSLYPVV